MTMFDPPCFLPELKVWPLDGKIKAPVEPEATSHCLYSQLFNTTQIAAREQEQMQTMNQKYRIVGTIERGESKALTFQARLRPCDWLLASYLSRQLWCSQPIRTCETWTVLAQLLGVGTFVQPAHTQSWPGDKNRIILNPTLSSGWWWD